MVGFLNDKTSHANDISESGFFITNMRMPALNSKFAVVGKVTSGLEELNSQLKNQGLSELRIKDCGECGVVHIEQPEYDF